MNATLKFQSDVEVAKKGLAAISAAQHPTDWKNWDLWDFMNTIVKEFPLNARILDVGCASSPLLLNLAEIGYTDLTGIDVHFPAGSTHPHDNIRYERGDLTRTRFNYQSFNVVTSLSVLEHGIDFEDYLREMSRILKPGGLLLTSTDFWSSKIRTWTVPKSKTFGAPWNILTPDDMTRLYFLASRWGLYPTSRIDTEVQDKVVKWGGKEYTFLSFALRKVGGK